MIRIKNISRENHMIRKGTYNITFPSGRIGKLLIGRIITIDYATYLINRGRIVLPGEPMHESAAFRVIGGMAEIEKNATPVKKPIFGLRKVTPPAESVQIVEETKVEVREESIEASSPALDETLSVTEEDVSNSKKIEPETISEDVDVEDVPPAIPAEPEIIEGPEAVGGYTEEALNDLTHKELNELLDKEGVDIPRQSNKQHKIDALMKLNG